MSDQRASPLLARPVSEMIDHIQGPPTAAVTLVEYGDFECPSCSRASRILKEVLQEAGERVRLVFRHFPMIHIYPQAQRAAEAAEAAAAQGKFWEMHDILYERQHALEHEDLLAYAAELELDVNRFNADLSAGVYAGRVREDFLSGLRSGVNGTPTFFRNGRRQDRLSDLQSLTDVINIAACTSVEADLDWHDHPDLNGP